MIDGIDFGALIIDVRDLVGEETGKFYSGLRCVRAINTEISRLARKIVALDSGYFDTVYTPTPADSIALPVNCYLVRNVQVYASGAWFSPRWISDMRRGDYQTFYGSVENYPPAVRVQDNTLYFEPGIGTASQVRILYTRMPAEGFYVTLSSGSSTTAVLPASTASVLDDVYNGDRFQVVDGTGQRQVSTVLDYVASTRTLTIAAGATLDNTSTVSTLLPEPLSKFPDVVVQGAAMRLLLRKRDSELYGIINDGYQRDVQDMLNALDQRQTMDAERGNFIPDGED